MTLESGETDVSDVLSQKARKEGYRLYKMGGIDAAAFEPPKFYRLEVPPEKEPRFSSKFFRTMSDAKAAIRIA